MTVQAPHCAMPQPNFVPVRPKVSRKTHSKGVTRVVRCRLGFSVNDELYRHYSVKTSARIVASVISTDNAKHRAVSATCLITWIKNDERVRRKLGSEGIKGFICPNDNSSRLMAWLRVRAIRSCGSPLAITRSHESQVACPANTVAMRLMLWATFSPPPRTDKAMHRLIHRRSYAD